MSASRGALSAGAAVAGGVVAALMAVAVWQVHLRQIDLQVQRTRATLKKLTLTGGIPPNQEVMNYLTARHAALERRYQHWLAVVAAPPLAEDAQADPQLYFQQQVHEVQRAIERLATARGAQPPEVLGLPKDLPPPDAVPRLLAQLALMQDATELLYAQGLQRVASMKIEDPTAAFEQGEGGPFLTQLPVRVRFAGSLTDMMKTLAAAQRATPMMDLLSLRLSATDAGDLDADLLLGRYLVSGAAANDASTLPAAPRAKPPTSHGRIEGRPKPSGPAKPERPASRTTERAPAR